MLRRLAIGWVSIQFLERMADEKNDKNVRTQRLLMGATLAVLFPFTVLCLFLIIAATIRWIDGELRFIHFIGMTFLMLLPILGSVVGKRLFCQMEGGYTRRIRRRLIEFYLSTLAGIYLFVISSHVTVGEQQYASLPQQASWVLILGLIPLLIVIFTKADKDDYEVALRFKSEDPLRVKGEEELRMEGEMLRRSEETGVSRFSDRKP